MLNKSEALYTPMVDLEDLFEDLSYDSVTQDLDLRVSGEPVARVRLGLIQQLKWTSGSPTNVELYEWARHICGNKSRYKSSRSYFSCPILEAYSDRRLGDSPFVQEIAGLFSREIQGAMLLDSAHQSLLLGRVESAETLARQSLDIYSGLKNQSGQAKALMLIGQANVESGAYIDAVTLFQKAVNLGPNDLNQAQMDLYLGEAYIGQGDLLAASLKLESALDKFKADGDKRSEGTVYTALGKLASHQGDYPRALSYLQRSRKLCKAVNDEMCVSSANRELARLEAVSSPFENASRVSNESLEREGFWGHLNPFARRKYVHMQTGPIRDRLNEVDEFTSANSKAIKDTDSRAQTGIKLASAKANEADQHAIDAGNKATQAQQTAQQATTRIQTVEQVVANIDQYIPSAEVEVVLRPHETVLSSSAKDALDEMANALKGQRGYIIEVQGFSSGHGQAAIADSQKIVELVVRYLVLNHEIPVYRIYMIGMGNVAISDKGDRTKPITSRRVEIKLLRTPQKPD
jgi:tetratricopeptide (TPR) repeat protein